MTINDIIGKKFFYPYPFGRGLVDEVEFDPKNPSKGRAIYYTLTSDGDFDKLSWFPLNQVLYLLGYYVVNDYGKVFDFRYVYEYMDDEIKEKLNYITTDTIDGNVKFFDEYCKEHEKKFGEPFEFAKENPMW